ncbi:hypothetical protein GGR53DRAFT_285445 [Hypoxylon sp. FL1150]|nr:hypothetical protein GGR53DRAFT_285445 [Hypoxylon sp. FL1150]
MADTRTLRIVTASTFLPAFPLCLAHGVVSSSPVPAVGLVPLAFSAGAGVFLASRQAARHNRVLRETEREDGDEGQTQEQEQGQRHGGVSQSEERSDARTRLRGHPILTFVGDTILAAALMVVLVFTWIDSSSGDTNSAETSMLAAYATIPLLVNFLIHLYLAVRELSRGLAIPGLTQYLAWQVIPPDCPDCGRRLRPDAPPLMPWLDEASLPERPNFQNVKFKLPTLPKMKVPKWKTPAWFRGRGADRGYAVAPVADGDDESTTVPYTDDPETGEQSTRTNEPETIEPEVVDVVNKKSRRLGRNSGSSS